jgi:SET family sugar efflux transporter-like MFS transporter
MPFVISVLALGVAGAAGAQVYAAARDELSRHPTPVDVEVMSTIRMAFTLGWVVGPVVGSVVGATLGLRAVLLGTAAFCALQLVPMIGVRAPRCHDPQAGSSANPRRPTGGWRELVPLLVFSALAILAISGDTIKFAYLPIYMNQHLGLPAGVRGAVIALQPVFELLLMPVAARLAVRVGALRVVLLGTLLGVLANLCYAFSSSATGLFVGQVLMAGLWAVIAGIGVTVAQQLYPRGVGVASSTFLSSVVFASTVGGLLGSAFVETLGIPGVFVVPAVLCAVSLVGMALLGRWLVPQPPASGAAEVGVTRPRDDQAALGPER